MLVLVFCGISAEENNSLTVWKAHSSMIILEQSWLQVMLQKFSGFHYLHAIGIIHNDIKTDNIWVVQDTEGFWDPKKARYSFKR